MRRTAGQSAAVMGAMTMDGPWSRGTRSPPEGRIVPLPTLGGDGRGAAPDASGSGSDRLLGRCGIEDHGREKFLPRLHGQVLAGVEGRIPPFEDVDTSAGLDEGVSRVAEHLEAAHPVADPDLRPRRWIPPVAPSGNVRDGVRVVRGQ